MGGSGFPSAREEFGNLGDVHRGQSMEDIGEVFLRVDPTTATTDDERVNYRTAPTRVGVPNEEPTTRIVRRTSNRVFDQIMPTKNVRLDIVDV